MRRISLAIKICAAFMLVIAGLSRGVTTANSTTTSVVLNPPSISVSGCTIADVYIDVNDVADLYALDVRLTFDPSVLEVVDYNTSTSIVEVEPVVDPGLNFNPGFTVRNEVNNFTGTIWYAATQMAPTPSANGSGHVLHIRLRAKSTTTTSLVIAYLKLSSPGGGMIDAVTSNATANASTSVIPALSISRLNASQIRLTWPALSGVSKYHIYRSTKPYFNAVDPAYSQVDAPGSLPATMTLDDSVLGNATTNYFYTMRAECSSGGKSASSTQLGKFEFSLYETSRMDFTWISIPLVVSGLTNAAQLADHIQNNSNKPVTVITITRWNNTGQTIDTYEPLFGINSFAITTRFPYRVEVDIDGSSPAIWALVGALPSIAQDTYTLRKTTGTDFNWIMQPLDLTSLTTASQLATHIQNNASASAQVLTISRWNGTGQTLDTYDSTLGVVDFTTRFGYPYRVEVNLSGSSVTWP